MTIALSLESDRAQELEALLTLLQPKIVDYVAGATKSTAELGTLGTYHEPQEIRAQFQHAETFESGLRSPQALVGVVEKILLLSVNTWNPGFLDKLYASNNPVGVVLDLVLSLLNTNLHVYTVLPVLSVMENDIGRQYAALFFDLQNPGGLTFSGGLWSNITALHMARAILYPDTKVEGNGAHRFVIFASQHLHYSVAKAAILMGLGSAAVVKVAISQGAMCPKSLEQEIARAKEAGRTPLAVVATAGTTVFGLYDDVEAIAKVAKPHGIWVHVDGLWGGNVVFSATHRHKVAGARHADSIATNPHKMLGVPNTCLFLLVPDVALFQTANSLQAPYLFHGREAGDENFDLADGTLGCGRRADALKFYLAWLYYGLAGFAERVDHAFRIAEYFVAEIRRRPGFRLVGPSPQCLQVCFYYSPPGWTGTSHTLVTRYVSRELHRQGRYLMDYLPNPDDDTEGEFFRVVFNLPILTSDVVDDLVLRIEAAGKAGLEAGFKN